MSSSIKSSIRKTIVKILQKLKLNRFAHKIYYRHIHGFVSASSGMENALEQVFDKAIELGLDQQGDYCEFGIFKGYAFWYAQQVAVKKGFDKMHFYGFDSFEGLPEIETEDKTSGDVFYQGQYACSYDEVVKNLDSKGVDWNKTTLVKGYFGDTLTQDNSQLNDLEKISVALIDCDLYSSTREVLEYIQPRLIKTAVLIFDDWDCFDKDDDRGQRRAFREFLAQQDHFKAKKFISYGNYGQSFIVTNAL